MSTRPTTPRRRVTSPGRATRDGRELAVDPIACVGHGLCAELFPEGIVLDDWGYPVLLDGAYDPAELAHAARAVRACPALALKLRARTL
ncbi:ferredoxin [Patulibacter sp. NPDC049589]|uniref:ferredoxin n=1 Tax=Patulibacter sp. NPDC049589 TaxID=3154731 RepID=UPI0034322FE8